MSISPPLSLSMISLLLTLCSSSCFFFFFFNDTATTEIYTLSLHDALPISAGKLDYPDDRRAEVVSILREQNIALGEWKDRKSTRLNSSHGYISYAVFCLKKKKKQKNIREAIVRSNDNKQSAHDDTEASG